MTAPKFFAIDPDVKYPFIPSMCREEPKGLKEALAAARKKCKDKTKLYDAEIEVYVQFLGKRGAPLPGAITLFLTPVPERLDLRIRAAKNLVDRTAIAGIQQFREYSKGLADDKSISPERRSELMAEKRREIEREQIRIGLEAYSPELRFDVLSSCVASWEGVRTATKEIAFLPGDWERNASALPREAKDEAFLALVDSSAFSQEDIRGFTSGQDSPSA